MTSLWLSLARRAKHALAGPLLRQRARAANDLRIQRLLQAGGPTVRTAQLILLLKYKEILKSGGDFLSFDETELRVFSQNGEDGILLYLFALLGTTNKKAVEICAGDGTECNTANLVVNHGWQALMFDGSPDNVARGRAFYGKCQDTHVWPPQFVNAWITKDNIDPLICTHGYAGEIDLLSLDLDGNDYWIWQAITSIRPRVVVLEYNNLVGPERAVTIPYDPEFVASFDGTGMSYGGASLMAFVKLGREKGYRLVGCQRYGFNAFFVRDDLGTETLPEKSPADCFQHPYATHSWQTRASVIKENPWLEV